MVKVKLITETDAFVFLAEGDLEEMSAVIYERKPDQGFFLWDISMGKRRYVDFGVELMNRAIITVEEAYRETV